MSRLQSSSSFLLKHFNQSESSTLLKDHGRHRKTTTCYGETIVYNVSESNDESNYQLFIKGSRDKSIPKCVQMLGGCNGEACYVLGASIP